MGRTGQVAGPGATAPIPAGIAFLADHGVPPSVLRRAARDAERQGVFPDEALIASGAVDPEAFARALAAALGVPCLGEGFRVGPAARYPESVLSGIAPLPEAEASGAPTFAVAPRGQALARLLAKRTPPGPGLAVATPGALRRAVMRARSGEVAAEAAEGLARRDPALSARDGITAGQGSALVAATGAVSIATTLWPGAVLVWGSLLAAPVFLGMVAFRLAAMLEGVPVCGPIPERRRPDAGLPVYTVLVPLYREPRVVPQLVAALGALDYPPAKLDIKLVLEAGDRETAGALAGAGLPGHWEIVVAPPGEPRTKPRALNVALALAQGEFTVVYDAEDVPDVDQLRLAVAAFDRSPADVACLQARLSIDNTGDSWLARMFTIEYAGLFDVINPGLARMDCPMPLGGTSNHFRTRILQSLGGWDAFNVTEDADLGIRMALRGWRVVDLPSTTSEEAPARLKPWMNQRVRWMKGFVQVCLTHSRHPVRAVRALGPVRFLGAVTMTAGTVLSALGFPVLTLLSLRGLLDGSLLVARSWGDALSAAVSLVLFAAGLGAMIGPGLLGVRRRGWRELQAWALLLPAYYLLVSAAAWRALWELAVDPFRWNKTEHGLARTSRRGAPQDAASRSLAASSGARLRLNVLTKRPFASKR